MDYREKKYWDDRAIKQFAYKRETFYTITAVPYYYKRRRIVLKLLKKCIEKNDVQSICDYGCGDGEYMRRLYTSVGHKGIMWKGYDISEEMLKKARTICMNCSNMEFGAAETGIPDGERYDLIYSVAVLAHIKDDICREIIHNFAEHIRDGGEIILCEQVGKFRVGG